MHRSAGFQRAELPGGLPKGALAGSSRMDPGTGSADDSGLFDVEVAEAGERKQKRLDHLDNVTRRAIAIKSH
jgi:hypothetical protein